MIIYITIATNEIVSQHSKKYYTEISADFENLLVAITHKG